MRRLVTLLISIALLGGGSACKKKPAPSAAKPAEAPVAPAVKTVLPALTLAARVPGEVECLVASAGFRQHLQALTSTHLWHRWKGSAEPVALPVEEFCLAGGPGLAESLATLRPLGDAYAAQAARRWIGGLILGQAWATDDVAAMDAVVLALERFQVPPLLLGLQGEEAHAWLQTAAAPLLEAPGFADAPASMITTTHGEQISLTEVDAGLFLTPELRRSWLDAWMAAHPGMSGMVKDKLAHAFSVLAGKTFVIALGKGKNSAWLGIAHQKEQFRLADGPEDSVLAQPPLAFAGQHASRLLLGISLLRAPLLAALDEQRPLLPMLRSLSRGWESLPAPFQGLAKALDTSLTAVETAALAQKNSSFSDAAAAAWWDGGLHLDARGGSTGEALQLLAQSSRHASLLDGDHVLIGKAGHDRAGDAAWLSADAWISLAHDAVLAFADSGMAGPKENLLWARFVADAAPSARDAWDSTRTLARKALGTDGALLLDAGGLMPALPGLPAGGEKVPLPRLCLVSSIQNRVLVSTAWEGIESSLSRMMQAFPVNPPPLLPLAEVLREKDLASHFYASPFASDDLMLCATLDDQTLLLGTSRAQQQALGRALSQPPTPATSPGIHFRLDFARLRTLLQTVADVRSKSSSDPGLQALLRWLEPLGDLRTRTWAQDGSAFHSLHWQLQDVTAP